MAYKWVKEAVVKALHDEQIAEHGGEPGIRDYNLLCSALQRPKDIYHYSDPAADISQLAAAYAYSIAKNHAFVDGNKRVALVTMELFLYLNGYSLDVTDASCVNILENIAAGTFSEDYLITWIRDNIERLES